jgi:hypothetical protein
MTFLWYEFNLYISARALLISFLRRGRQAIRTASQSHSGLRIPWNDRTHDVAPHPIHLEPNLLGSEAVRATPRPFGARSVDPKPQPCWCCCFSASPLDNASRPAAGVNILVEDRHCIHSALRVRLRRLTRASRRTDVRARGSRQRQGCPLTYISMPKQHCLPNFNSQLLDRKSYLLGHVPLCCL